MMETLLSINFWLIVLFTGAFVWVIRQVIPAKLEKTKWFRLLLKISPVFIGAGISLIPGLRPAEAIAQCLLLGFIGGTFSQTAYGILRSIAPDKIKSVIGGKEEK